MSAPVESRFICSNCEEEFKGLPAGARASDGRPLCRRCSTKGLREGWAERPFWEPCDERILFESTKIYGLVCICLIIILIVAFVLFLVFLMTVDRSLK